MEIAPRRWCPPPGKQVKLGSPSKARFTLPEEPRIRKCLISWTKSDGRSCSSNNFKKDIKSYLDGEARIEMRAMLEANIKDLDTMHALNDITVARGKVLRVIEVSTEINDVHLSTYRGDGVVVSSPTGSTAYALSLGSPVMDPLSENILLKPIATHMSQFGGVVVGKDAKIKLTVFTRNDAILNIDGFKDIQMRNNDSVEIRISSFDPKTYGCENSTELIDGNLISSNSFHFPCSKT